MLQKSPSSKSVGGLSSRRSSRTTTIVDLFLSGEQLLGEETCASLIPDPVEPESDGEPALALAAADAQLAYKDRGGRGEQGGVQDYWKEHAGRPAGPEGLRAAAEQQERFARAFGAHASKGGERRHLRTEDLESKLAFVVLALEKVGLREQPTLGREALTGEALLPGQCVLVTSVLARPEARFLRLDSGGWVFDRKDGRTVMAQAERIEVGRWWYRVACAEFLEARRVPSAANGARTGWILAPGEVCVVGTRCKIDGRRFLQLADGRGWLFAQRPAEPGAEEEAAERLLVELGGARGELASTSQLHLPAGRGVVERGVWLYEVLGQPVLALGASAHGVLLRPGEKVQVDLRAPASGRRTKEVSSRAAQTVLSRTWLRLLDGRGWIPKTDAQSRALVRFLGVEAGPRPGRASRDLDPGPSELSGVA